MLFLEESGLGGAGDDGASAAFLAQLLLHLVQVLQETSIPGLHACECYNATESRAQTFGCTCFTESNSPLYIRTFKVREETHGALRTAARRV